MAKKIIQYGNPVLEQRAEEVADISSVQDLVKEMLDTLKNHEKTGAGLSAPQIGVSKRVAICRRVDIEDRTQKKEGKEKPIWEVMINPVIVKKSEVKSLMWEGCLSINFGKLYGEVPRAKTVTVEYLNEKGEKKSLVADDYFSHVVQHEIDHLDGILFIRYIEDPSELYTDEELKESR